MKYACAIACLAGAATTANAGFDAGTVTFTYSNPFGQQGFTLETDAGASTLTASTTVDLSLDLTDVGGAATVFDDARFEFASDVGQANGIGGSIFLADVTNAVFAFYDTMGTADESDDELIFQGSFGSEMARGDDGPAGTLFFLDDAGSLSTTDSEDGGFLTYSLGPALMGLTYGTGLSMGDDADASWAFSNVNPGVSQTVEGNFDDFTADSAFTGSFTLVPSPGSMALVSIGGFFFVRSRSRR